jgi:hypothetical protein
MKSAVAGRWMKLACEHREAQSGRAFEHGLRCIALHFDDGFATRRGFAHGRVDMTIRNE